MQNKYQTRRADIGKGGEKSQTSNRTKKIIIMTEKESK